MKKILLSAITCLLCSALYINAAQAQSVANPMEKLEAKKTETEAKINSKQNILLKRIDAKIAQAKSAGKPTDDLEKRREEILKRISAKEAELNSRIDAQKAKLNQN